jgi:hypothetical protein
MSPLFIKLFKKNARCHYCKANKKEGYSVCPKHLKAAKLHWRKWQIVRKGKGLCCYCDKESFNGYLRCKTHTEINKAKCKSWHKKNRQHRHNYFLRQLNHYQNQGRCRKCKPHRKVSKGHTNCWTCRKRLALWSANITTSTKITRQELMNLLKQNHLSLN